MPDTPTNPPEKTAAQKRADERAEIRRKEQETAAALKAKHDGLKSNIGRTFTDGNRTAAVLAFEPSKELGGSWEEAFLVNFGNPNRHDYVHCEQFLTDFKPKEQ